MRISTTELFRQGVGAIQGQQVDLARIQQQLATGKRILSPSDDPAGAVQVLKLDDRLAEIEQFSRNAGLAKARLGQEESVLEQMGETLQRARELTVQAANATQTSESRAAIAQEIRQLADGLLDAANTRDAAGEYLFAGYRTTTMPFVRGQDGSVDYLGDGGQRRLALSPDRTLAVGDSGNVFMTVPRGNGTFVVNPADANLGTGRVTVMEVTDPRAVGAESFEIRFSAVDSYEIRDGAGALVATGDHLPEGAIEIGGRRIVVAGAPAAGDVFRVEPAGQGSVFDVLDDLAARLATPASGPAGSARLSHDIDLALRGVDHALDRILEVRTGVGARLNAVDAQTTLNEDQELRMQTMLSEIQDLDYAEAISAFQQKQVALQAAQQAYIQMSRLSLFDYIR